jgi:hypothetical protein
MGTINQLIPRHPILATISPALIRTTIDGANIKEPVVAISATNAQKFIGELECLSFLTACDRHDHAEDEIFSQKTTFMVSEQGNEICVNQHFWLSPIQQLQFVQSQDFPRAYFRWDKESILQFETFFAVTLTTELYSALTKCLSNVNDKETHRERSRIVISITLFNQAYIDSVLIQPFGKNRIILIASAFEALLNLPSETIQKTFQNAVMTLVGSRTSMLKKWCTDFYDYRSGLVHGDVAWENQEKEYFSLPDGKNIDHSAIAHHLFVRCLKTKLFLAGLLPGYQWTEFSFDGLDNA